MANSFNPLISKFLPLMDEVYKQASKTAILDDSAAKFVGANAIKFFKMTMDGLGDYSRNAGYVGGDVTGTWETMTLAYDRGRKFSVDAMDNEEEAGLAFGRLASEFIRTKVVPEVDAYTFAKICQTANISVGTPVDIVPGTTDVPSLIDAGTATMNDDEVSPDRILFISEACYRGLQAKITRVIENDAKGINRTVEYYDNMRIVRVPQNRFYTKITLNDGSTAGETAGGYAGTTSTGYKINFLIVDPAAIEKVTKHVVPKVFSPAENQDADAWKFMYRLYGDTFVYDNKVAGVYLNRGNTALS